MTSTWSLKKKNIIHKSIIIVVKKLYVVLRILFQGKVQQIIAKHIRKKADLP